MGLSTVIKRTLLILLLFLINISCKKFIDIKKNSQQNLIETADDCQFLLNDYANMNVGYPSDGEVSADNYYLNDAGYLNVLITEEDRNIYTWQLGAIRIGASPQWQYPYHVVYLSNLILEALENLKGNPNQATVNDLRGQALFFRAYSFWQVAQLYTKPYTSENSSLDPGIPLRLKSDINGKSERGTLDQTYSKIVTDLQEAASLLLPSSIVASRPNKAAAYAMLARVYLTMEDYPNALNNASQALQLNSQLIDYNTLDVNSSTPFVRFNKEVVFHSIMTRTNILNPGSATSNIAKVDLKLVGSYDSNDLRKLIFFKPNSGSNSGSFRFTGNYEPVTNASLFDGIAVDELYLIRAECYARAGNTHISDAMNDLNTLLKSRWKSGTYKDMSANTVDEALNKILIERRKELLMRGIRWTDLRRLNKDDRFKITLNRTVIGNSYNLPPSDTRYTLLIPTEVINNSSISQNIQ